MARVLIVDDTALMRQYLKQIIETSFQDVEVILAPNGIIALEKIKVYEPDVITLDFEMPEMNGIECLQEIVKITSVPVIMVSAYTSQGAKVTIDALSLGAFDFVCKPKRVSTDKADEFEVNFVEKIDAAIYFRKKRMAVRKASPIAELIKTRREETEATLKRVAEAMKHEIFDYLKIQVVGIGISTGGPSVVREILTNMPKHFKLPILIVQHMPVGFTAEFAQRLNEVCQIEVKEAADGDIIKPGTALIAPGGKHLSVEKIDGVEIARVTDGEKVSGHKPSADVLFSSLAKDYGPNGLGIIMTGMGSDGSQGLLKMKNSGAVTWGQSEETCVVYGMPKAAAEIGAVEEMLSVDGVISKLKQIDASLGARR